jgi:hypothetical protein
MLKVKVVDRLRGSHCSMPVWIRSIRKLKHSLISRKRMPHHARRSDGAGRSDGGSPSPQRTHTGDQKRRRRCDRLRILLQCFARCQPSLYILELYAHLINRSIVKRSRIRHKDLASWPRKPPARLGAQPKQK